MTDPVPAPEQQGDDKLYEDARESLRQAEAGERPTPREELRMKPVEQQGEPARCVALTQWGVCGEAESADLHGDDGPEMYSHAFELPGTEPGEPVCVVCGLTEGASMTEMERRQIEYHPFEPAPPPSEEAEARRWLRAEESPDFVVWRVNNKDGLPVAAQTISKELEAAIRSPLEERVRELEALVAPTTAAKAWSDIREERDRLRGLLRSMHAAGEVDGRNALIARAEAAEAQVNKLREALEHIQKRIDVQGPTGVPLLIEISAHTRRALAETVQEGGETK